MKPILKLLCLLAFCLVACSKDDDSPTIVESHLIGQYSGLYTTEIFIEGEITVEYQTLVFSIIAGATENEMILVYEEGQLHAIVQGNNLIFESENSTDNGVTYTFSGTGEFYVDNDTNKRYMRLDIYTSYTDETSTSSAHGYGDFLKQ